MSFWRYYTFHIVTVHWFVLIKATKAITTKDCSIKRPILCQWNTAPLSPQGGCRLVEVWKPFFRSILIQILSWKVIPTEAKSTNLEDSFKFGAFSQKQLAQLSVFNLNACINIFLQRHRVLPLAFLLTH